MKVWKGNINVFYFITTARSLLFSGTVGDPNSTENNMQSFDSSWWLEYYKTQVNKELPSIQPGTTPSSDFLSFLLSLPVRVTSMGVLSSEENRQGAQIAVGWCGQGWWFGAHADFIS